MFREFMLITTVWVSDSIETILNIGASTTAPILGCRSDENPQWSGHYEGRRQSLWLRRPGLNTPPQTPHRHEMRGASDGRHSLRWNLSKCEHRSLYIRTLLSISEYGTVAGKTSSLGDTNVNAQPTYIWWASNIPPVYWSTFHHH